MFGTAKTLIVVYKDEMIVNQLKKLVESNDDGENNVVGTTDGSINIVAWDEKVWLDNKKAGNIKEKVLFIGDVKGTDKLTPVLDIKFSEYGVTFGWAGNQAVLYVDPKELRDEKKYASFFDELTKYPVPDMIKKPLIKKGNDLGPVPVDDEFEEVGKDNKVLGFLNTAKNVAAGVALATGGAVVEVAGTISERKAIKRQMLFYGVVKMYRNFLEEFITQ